MTAKITSKQENQLCDFFRAGLRKLNFSKAEAQEIIQNGGIMQTEIKLILQKLGMTDARFRPAIMDIEFTVPADYSAEQKGDNLKPGKSYRVRVFPIYGHASRSDCLMFLKKQGAILVSHGEILDALRGDKSDEWPVDKYIVYVDRKRAIIDDVSYPNETPSVFFRSEQRRWDFFIGRFEQGWDKNNLLCVTEI